MIELTSEQRRVIADAKAWFRSSTSDQVFEISGMAGTGKSVVLQAIVQELHLDEEEYAACAYTGAAALVMRKKGFPKASTLHSLLYQYVVIRNRDGSKFAKFVPKEQNLFLRLIIVDEAGFCDQNIKKDLLNACAKILVAGDTRQLPPIVEGPPAFFTNPDKIHYLTKIMRQNENSAIIQLANSLLRGQHLRVGNYGDVIVIPRSEFDKNMPALIKSYGIILCGTNNTKEKINSIVRKDILRYTNPLPQIKERIINRKNLWDTVCEGIPLVNGLVGTVIKSSSFVYEGDYLVDFKADFMDSVFREVRADYSYLVADPSEKREMRSLNGFSNSTSAKFEYAYACTTHVAQGSQFESGIYIEEYFPKISKNLYYTGLTRFSQRALYVIPDRKVYVPNNVDWPRGDKLIPVPKVN